jgi:hypothetical protein
MKSLFAHQQHWIAGTNIFLQCSLDFCRRAIPDRVDEILEVPLPARCPRCGGGLQESEIVSQYQTEIPGATGRAD